MERRRYRDVGRGRRWKGKEVAEVRKFTYLGYTILIANGKQDAHVGERVRKGVVVLGQVWRIKKRKFERDWGRRIWLFDKLVWLIASYGIQRWE